MHPLEKENSKHNNKQFQEKTRLENGKMIVL